MNYLEEYAQSSSIPPLAYAIIYDNVTDFAKLLRTYKTDQTLKFTQIPEFPLKALAGEVPILSVCALFGSVQCITFLLLIGADINVLNNCKCSPTFFAISGGRLDVLEYLINNGADINIIDNRGANILFHAIRINQIEIIKYLVEKVGMDVNLSTQRGATPLMWAAAYGDCQMFDYVLNKTNEPSQKTSGGWLPIHYAVKKGQENVFNYILSTKTYDIDAALNDGTTCLLLAIKDQLINFIDLLISKGASVSTSLLEGKRVEFKTNPLVLGVMTKKANVVEKLISCQKIIDTLTPNVIDRCLSYLTSQQNVKATKKTTPALSVCPEMLRAILELVKRNTHLYPENPLEFYVYEMINNNANVDAIKVVFDVFDINVNWANKDDHFKTFVHCAAEKKNVQILTLLLNELKASPNLPDEYSRSPLYASLCLRNFDIALFLINQYGVDVNIGSMNESNLQLGMHLNNQNIIDALLAKGAI